MAQEMGPSSLPSMPFKYPPARRSDIEDDYHGTVVADPYRWLEDPDDSETRAFVGAQNEVTAPYLESLPEVSGLRERIGELWDTPRTGAPRRRGGVLVWAHNDGLANQSTFYISRTGSDPEVLLDPNTFSHDGTVAVTAWSLSPDGSYMAYTRSEAGSDQQTGRILDTRTGEHLADELHELRFTGLAWLDDGFFYSRFPGLEAGTVGLFKDCSVFYHRAGTEQSGDALVFANPDHPDLLYTAVVSDDNEFVVLYEYDGTSRENGMLFRPASKAGEPFTRIVHPGVASYQFLAHIEGTFLVETNDDAPNGRVVAVPLDDLETRHVVIEEAETAIEISGGAAGRIVVVRLDEASHRVSLYQLDGTPDGEIALPAPGSVAELTGRMSDPVIYTGFQSFLYPPTVIRWEGGEASLFAESRPQVDPEDFEVERSTATSSDGTEVGMFIVRHKNTDLPAPTELYGYGGFNINLTPVYSPARLAWLEAGGVVVTANLRGGSEHGEEWHRQGMLGNKQQVFDDFIAAAMHLVESGVTTRAQLGIRGGSNGGLLVTAVMLQQPGLFGAVVAQVPVTDMYRYQHFSAGRFWTVEYGDAEKSADAFGWLSKYSPLHNVEAGVDYPPLLVLTAETDDRVVPMHSHKFVAQMQNAAGGASENPILERIETRAGHGMGKPTSKLIGEAADIYGFMLHHLGTTDQL
jgi:prolyl oligopeptidase